ncbi:MAG: DUF1592 domain-containing protein [Nannocystaceae bacterium]|nr:DUF1592 domain-containing protein [Nannocystaceae bacterium]
MATTGKAHVRIALGIGALLVSSGCYRGSDGAAEGGASGTEGDDDGADDGADGAPDPFCEEDTLPGKLSRFVRLTHRQYDNTVKALLTVDTTPAAEFLNDAAIGGFNNNADQLLVNNNLARDYRRAAEQLGDALVTDSARLASLLPCTPDADPDGCAAMFIAQFGHRAFRRPLTSEEQAQFEGLYQTGGGLYESGSDFEQGISFVVEAFLQAPSFLYRSELTPAGEGQDVVALSGYEIASRLSYMMWNSMPDDELFAAAEAGMLDDAQGVQAQARRMLEDPRAADPIEDFHQQWLGMSKYASLSKDPDMFPEFVPGMADSMQAETLAFARNTILTNDGTFTDLMTSTDSYVDERLAPLYGLEGEFGPELTPVSLDPAQRAGFLTHIGFLAGNAYFAGTSPIHRGVFVQRQVMCTTIPDPPGDADLELPPFDEELTTTRQRVEHHTSADACQGCHSVINEPGFAFEGYDAIGVLRTEENGVTVDTQGSFATPDGEMEFTDAVDMIHKIAESPQAQRCYLTQWFRYASSRTETVDDLCSLNGMHENLVEGDYNVKELLVSLTRTVSFRYRNTVEE